MSTSRCLILLLFTGCMFTTNNAHSKELEGQLLKEGLIKRDWYAAGYVRASLRLLTARGMACPPDQSKPRRCNGNYQTRCNIFLGFDSRINSLRFPHDPLPLP